MGAVRWRDATRFDVDGVGFEASTVPLDVDDLVLIKTPHLVRQHLALLEAESPRRIVELGIKDGGSAALMALVAQPELLVGVDLESRPPPKLVELVQSGRVHGSVRMALGIDQGDRGALTAVIDEHVGIAPLDLVVDDASHLLEPTTISFDLLFPRLRPGGVYVIEDWSWESRVASLLADLRPDVLDERLAAITRIVQILNTPGEDLPAELVAAMAEAHARRGVVDDGQLFVALICAAADVDREALALVDAAKDRPMADLAVALAMVAATRPGLVSELTVTEDWLVARRGPASLPAEGFRLADAWSDPFAYLRPA